MTHSIFGGAAAAPLSTLGLATAAPATAPLLAILVDAGRRAREAAIAGIRAGNCRTRVDHTGPEMPTADGMRVARRVYGSGRDGPMPGKTDETIRFWVNDPGGRARQRRQGLTAPASLRGERRR